MAGLNHISKAYVNTLRFVSAQGKKSILETTQPLIKKGEKLMYGGQLKYNSIPIGIPNETIGGFSFKTWEKVVTQAGGTKQDVLERWFDIITPKEIKLSRIEQELNKFRQKENIEKIKFFKTLSKEEKLYLEKYYASPEFVATLSGHKPAWYCDHNFNGKIDFSKIKLNPEIAEKYDVVNLPKGSLYFLNKEKVLNIIKENKDVYCAELGLNQASDLEDIYKSLLKMLEGEPKDALFGMTLGFPRHSSMIYELENYLGRDANLRNNIPLLKEKLLKALHSEKSPFANCPKATIERLEKHIKEMDCVGGSNGDIVQYVTFGNEKEAVERTLALEKDFKECFKIEDLFS